MMRTSKPPHEGRMASCPENVHHASLVIRATPSCKSRSFSFRKTDIPYCEPAALRRSARGQPQVSAFRSELALRRRQTSRGRVKRGGNIAHADHARERDIVDDGQMANTVHRHEMAYMLERVAGSAGNETLHRDQLRDLQIDTGSSLLGDRAHHVALCEHADRGIAFGADDVLHHQRANIVRAHQLGGHADGLVHPNRDHASGLLAQNVSDQHRNLLLEQDTGIDWYTIYQLSIRFLTEEAREKQFYALTFMRGRPQTRMLARGTRAK